MPMPATRKPRPIKVLLVDDDPDDAAALQRMLEDADGGATFAGGDNRACGR